MDDLIRNCAGRDSGVEFFPSTYAGVLAAKRVCLTCTVRVQCVDYAVTNGEHDGVWGATSPEERKELARRRRASR